MDKRKWVKYTDVYPKLKGYHGLNIPGISQGQMVRIPKDVYVSTTKTNGDSITTRSQIIKVINIMPGSTDNIYLPESRFYTKEQNSSVCWAGTGGYWKEVEINDIEIEVL